MKKSEILRDTFRYYAADTSRRCPGRFNHDSKHCAVGRYLREEYKALGTELPGNDGSARYLNERNNTVSLDEMLIDEVRGYGTEFWTDLLKWHDEDRNFNKDGLTEAGVKKALELVNRYVEDEYVRTEIVHDLRTSTSTEEVAVEVN